jgi:hypothetical protein
MKEGTTGEIISHARLAPCVVLDPRVEPRRARCLVETRIPCWSIMSRRLNVSIEYNFTHVKPRALTQYHPYGWKKTIIDVPQAKGYSSVLIMTAGEREK